MYKTYNKYTWDFLSMKSTTRLIFMKLDMYMELHTTFQCEFSVYATFCHPAPDPCDFAAPFNMIGYKTFPDTHTRLDTDVLSKI